MPDHPQRHIDTEADRERKNTLNNRLKFGASNDLKEGPESKRAFSLAKDEERMQESDKQRLLYWELRHHEKDLEDQRSARKMRENFANSAFKYLSGYSISCLFLLFFEGISIPRNVYIHFNISDNVLLALVGSTAVSVLGLVGIVLSGLFKK